MTKIKSLPVPAVEETIAFVRRNISREAVIGAVRRVDRWTFPPAALREAVVNAVVQPPCRRWSLVSRQTAPGAVANGSASSAGSRVRRTLARMARRAGLAR
jgi:hypothetical protein